MMMRISALNVRRTRRTIRMDNLTYRELVQKGRLKEMLDKEVIDWERKHGKVVMVVDGVAYGGRE
jgi:hypothetical protein